MKRLLRIMITTTLIISFSTVVHAQMGEYKKLNQRIAILYKNGKFVEAIDVAKEVIKVAEETFGADHAYVISSLNNLALIYFQDEQYDNAKQTYEKSLLKTENLV
ncbi:MAG: tetratricopeptide repeat protein, partial [Deltaproteobacteria bacterium]|nr:tetratricopeptide repeat protein [Deltaproteobacteria bacterium]